MKFELYTERLYLRSLLPSDADLLYKLMSDSRITKFLSWEAHTSIETTQTVVNNLIFSQNQDKGYHWCICMGGIIIGLVSLIDVKRKLRTWVLNRAELSYWIQPEYQGLGLTTEASKVVVDFGFKNLNLHKIIVAHVEENIGSKSICNKLGFTPFGLEHDAFYKYNKWHHLVWYELINDEIDGVD